MVTLEQTKRENEPWVEPETTIFEPGTKSTTASPGEQHNERGLASYAAGDAASAIHAFTRAIEADPGHAEAHNNRGFVRETLGDVPGALADYDRALAIRPNYVEARLNRAAARHASGDLDGALGDYDKALDQAPRSDLPSILHGRGGVLLTMRRFLDAIQDLDRALTLNPRLWPAYISRGNARYHAQDPNAVDDYAVALALRPNEAAREIVRKLAADLSAGARGVILNCERHLRAVPTDGLSLARRCLTKVLLNREAEARVDLDRFLDARPDFAQQMWLLITQARREREAPSPVRRVSCVDASPAGR